MVVELNTDQMVGFFAVCIMIRTVWEKCSEHHLPSANFNIYNFIHHQTMIVNTEKNKQIEIIKN